MSGFLYRLMQVILLPLTITGAIGFFLLGDDLLGDDEAGSWGEMVIFGNLVWLVILTIPIWVPLLFLRWLVFGPKQEVFDRV